MALVDDVPHLGAIDMARLIREKAVSPVELMDAVIGRIEKRNPSLNAIVHKGFDEARAGARAAEKAVMSGAELAPLHGVPTAMKDCLDFKPGWPSTFGGVRCLANAIADRYCVFAGRIEEAGAIIVGKTNSPQFGFRGTCDNLLFGATSTPFAIGRNSGGSSGGSAAAVGDGLLPFAEGTDGGGSIRIPSAWCGVFGYKASFGRVPCVIRPNAFGGASPFLYEGIISRSVADGALATTLIAGYDPRDPFCLDEKVDFTSAPGTSIKGWRIGYSRDFAIFPVEPAVLEVMDEAVKAFEAAGAIVEEVDPASATARWSSPRSGAASPPATLSTCSTTTRRSATTSSRTTRIDLPPEMHEWHAIARSMTLADRRRDLAVQTRIYEAMQACSAPTAASSRRPLPACRSRTSPAAIRAGPRRSTASR